MEVFEGPNAFKNMQILFADTNNNPYKQSLRIQIGKNNFSVTSRKKSILDQEADLLEQYWPDYNI